MSTGVLQPEEVTDLVADLQRLAARLEPDQIADGDVAGLIADLGQAQRLITGMTTLMARRSTVNALATATGVTPNQARRTYTTSTHLMEQPDVAAAVREGSLSPAQAEAVTGAVSADPSATQTLLRAAAKQSVADLQKTCRETVMAADTDRDETRARHHRNRCFNSWYADDGEWHARISGPADYGARVEAALRAEHDRVFRQAHAEGRQESSQAYKLDALVNVLDGTSGGRRGSGRQTKVIKLVDAKALKRDRLDPQDRCDIAGIGPVSLSAMKEHLDDAEIAIVIRDGRDVSVTHLGRKVTAHQRTAMEARGYECEVPACRTDHLLEIDHVDDWAMTYRTQLDQLAWLCPDHHDQKTKGAYRLTGPPGDRQWTKVEPLARTG